MEMENFPSETSDLQIENSTSSLVSEVNEDPIETTIDPIEEFSTYIENDGDKEVNNSSSIEPGMEDPEELSKLESELYKKLDNLDKMMNYNYPTLDIKKQALLSINNESKSSLKCHGSLLSLPTNQFLSIAQIKEIIRQLQLL